MAYPPAPGRLSTVTVAVAVHVVLVAVGDQGRGVLDAHDRRNPELAGDDRRVALPRPDDLDRMPGARAAKTRANVRLNYRYPPKIPPVTAGPASSSEKAPVPWYSSSKANWTPAS